MEDDPEQLDRYVDDLLGDRRPERTPLGGEDALEARRMAAMLRAARPGSTLPSSEYRDRVGQAIADAVRARGVPSLAGRPSRRWVLITSAGSLVAGILATLGVERLTQKPTPVSVVPTPGSWQPLMALASLPEQTPVRFSHGPLEGYVIRNGNSVSALSALCTHMPCVLNWSTLRAQFECPCHGATFEANGQPSAPYQLAALPRIHVRINKDQVEIFSV